MFEQEYKKMFRDVKPSQNLEIETLGLLLEMRDHPPAVPAPKRRLKPVFITTAASLAAVFILTFIGIGVHQGLLNKRMGNELLLSDEVVEDIDGEDLFGDGKADQDSSPGATGQDEEAEELKDSVEDTKEDSKNDSAPNSTADEGTASDDKDSSADDKSESSEDEDKKDSNGNIDQIVQEYNESYKGGNDNSYAMNYIRAKYAPAVLSTDGIRTYLSIKEFADALEKRSTLGYGSKYYNARELLIVPTKLPENCNFRQLYLDTNTGAYTYQYALAFEGYPYLVTVENKSHRAASLQELKEQIGYLEGEEVQYSIRGNVLTYTFGTETIMVTVTSAADGYEVSDSTCQVLFNRMDLGRSTLDNEILEMTFPPKAN